MIKASIAIRRPDASRVVEVPTTAASNLELARQADAVKAALLKLGHTKIHWTLHPGEAPVSEDPNRSRREIRVPHPRTKRPKIRVPGSVIAAHVDHLRRHGT